MDMSKTYNPREFEEKLYKEWEKKGYFRAEVSSKKQPFSIVIPPPNITGQLHMGHALNNSIQDTIIRFKRMQGYSTLWFQMSVEDLRSCIGYVPKSHSQG